MTSVPSTVTTQPGSIVPYEEVGLEWSDFGLDDIAPIFPVTKVTQSVSRMADADRHGGDFWHSDTETYDREIAIVVLARSNTRALFEDKEDQPLCRSVDGVVPLPSMPLWSREEFRTKAGEVVVVDGLDYPKDCASCPFSQWRDFDATGNRIWDEEKTAYRERYGHELTPARSEPPLCRESDVYLVDRGMGDLSQLRLSGKNLRPLRQWIARRCIPKRIAPFNFRVMLGTERKEGNGNVWQEIILRGVDQLPPAEASGYANLLREQRARFEKTIRDSERVEWTDDDVVPNTTWGDGKTSYRTEPVDPDTGEIGVPGRAPTPSRLSRTAAEMFPKGEQG